MAREIVAETGLIVRATGLREVRADLRALPEREIALHTDRVIYRVSVTGGMLRDRTVGSTDLARWISPSTAAVLSLRPFTALVLGLPAATDPRPDAPVDLPSFLTVPGPDGRPRAQRFAAYAVATDPANRVLLCRIAPGYPGGGSWHLPGGGTEYGEQPAAAMLREVEEETGQEGRIIKLLGDASHRDRSSVGPEGYPIDWHGVRVYFRVMVDRPTEPRVLEGIGGSTAAARWFTRVELAGLRLTEVTAEALAHAELLDDDPGGSQDQAVA